MECKEDIFKWLKMFAIWTVILIIAGAGFEYVVFGGAFYYQMNVAGMRMPAVLVYGVLIGIAFSTAQFVLKPIPRRIPSPPQVYQQASASTYKAPKPARKAMKKKAKGKRKR